MADNPNAHITRYDNWDARPVEVQLREACSAVLHGAIWCGFDGPDGVSKDDALAYAVKLAEWVQSNLDGEVER